MKNVNLNDVSLNLEHHIRSGIIDVNCKIETTYTFMPIGTFDFVTNKRYCTLKY